jgi:hypothetical protein
MVLEGSLLLYMFLSLLFMLACSGGVQGKDSLRRSVP